ncbi:putative NAD(P)-binding domain superfamily [Septoria linicola]|nr:putative NAD(P)-binding domain superfamily [Septoria linicola]
MQALLSDDQKKRLQHVSVDLQGGADKIASQLREAKVEADYVFYYSYMNPASTNAMDPSASKQLYKLNVPLFDNFLQALPKANIKPKRVLLQTGGKNYGIQIGRASNPAIETDPQPKHIQPAQFYYAQERLLFDFCEKHKETSWNIVMPFAILGAVNKTWLNAFYSFVCLHGSANAKGEPLEFGGDFEAWQFAQTHSNARMSGYLSEWAVLSPHTANQRFNATDGSPLSWERFFPELVRWYDVKPGVTLPKLDSERSFPHVTEFAGGRDSPLGYGPPMSKKLEFTLADWARKEENKQSWKEIMQASKGQVTFDPFESDEDIANTFMGDFCYLSFGTIGQNKLRRFGSTGYVDSRESVFEMYQECAKLGMLPEMKVNEARPMI